MSPLGSRTRARQRDRDGVADALSLAYADGQIDLAEHERRVARALAASRLDDLRPLVADVQLPGEHPAATLVAPAPPATRDPERRSRRERARVRLAAVVGGLAAVVGVLAAVVGVTSDQDSSGGDLRPFAASGLSQLVTDYEAEFGTTEVLQVEIWEEYVSVLVPADGGAGRYVQYYYDASGFRKDQGGSVAGTPDPVDLADVDVERLSDNLAVARDTLGVEDAEVERVLIADDAEAGFSSTLESGREIPAHVEIWVTNEYAENGSMFTDLDGTEVLVEYPYDA